MSRLEDLLTYPPRGRMPCLLLFGSTGMGKSEILNRFAELHAGSYDVRAGMATMPVVAVQMPPQPTEEEFYTELMLAEFGTKVLVLDEIDKMLAGTPRQQRIFLNTIRFLTNDLKIPIVCAGTEDARIAVLTDPNLADRFGVFELLPDATITNCANSWRVSLACCLCAALPCSTRRRYGNVSLR